MTETMEPKVVLRGGIGDGVPVKTLKERKPTKTAQEIQVIVDELIFLYGANLSEHADYRDHLTAAGLTPKQVTPEMLVLADERARKRVSLSRCSGAVPIQLLPPGSSFRLPGSSMTGVVVQISESYAKVIAVNGDGKPNHQEWSPGTQVIPESREGAKERHERSVNELNRQKEAKEKALRSDNGTTKKNSSKVKTSTGSGGAKKDRFGCLMGKEPASVNAVLTCEPQTAEVIAEKVGLTPERVNWQLKYYQREKGYVKLSDKGWALVEGWTE